MLNSMVSFSFICVTDPSLPPRMTSYRFPHHRYRSFTSVQDDDYRFPHYNSKSFANVSYDT